MKLQFRVAEVKIYSPETVENNEKLIHFQKIEGGYRLFIGPRDDGFYHGLIEETEKPTEEGNGIFDDQASEDQ